jgi:large subunit ribosomal protein L6
MVAWQSIPKSHEEHIIFHSHKKARTRARLRFLNIRTTKRIRLKKSGQYTKFYIPYTLECTVLQSSTAAVQVFISGPQHFLSFPLFNSSDLHSYDQVSRVVTFTQVRVSAFEIIYMKFLKLLLTSIVQRFFCKMKFRGKGYKLGRSRGRRTLAFQFGHSHRIFEYTYYATVKFIVKQALTLHGINLFDIRRIAQNIRRWRPINIYTGRGIRFNRQAVYRKQGKVKAYK